MEYLIHKKVGGNGEISREQIDNKGKVAYLIPNLLC